MTAVSNVPSMGIFTCGRGQKCYIEELAKDKHFRILELPKLVADWVAQTGFFKESSRVVSLGFSKILSAESLIYLANDICEYPTRIVNLKDRVIQLYNEGEQWTSQACMDVAHEVRRLACLIGGTVADWFEGCEFLKNVSLLKESSKNWFVPSEVAAKVGNMMISASKFYDIMASLTPKQITRTDNEELNNLKREMADDIDRVDAFQWGAIFAINAVGLSAIAAGVVVAPIVTLGFATTIFATKIVSHYKTVQLDSLNTIDPQTKLAVANLK